MPDIILNILSIIGIILLICLCIVLILLLLILFVPITYRLYGQKSEAKMNAWAKVNWLFGLIRLQYAYPEPGKVQVKLLFFTLYDSKKREKSKKAAKREKDDKQAENKSEKQPQPESVMSDTLVQTPTAEQADSIDSTIEKHTANDDVENSATQENVNEKQSFICLAREKYEKIKYTLKKIYDKIKHIIENISFYRALLQDEDTKRLFRHAGFRLKKIWKNIHPHKLKGELLFGTGSPDTTGYALGVYGILSPMLGQNICVTPDFTQTILEGNIYVAGHITLFQVGMHSLIFLFDKRLRLLIQRIKTHTI